MALVISELCERNIFGYQGKEVPEIPRILWNPNFVCMFTMRALVNMLLYL